MRLEGEGMLLRIFIGEADTVGHRALHEVIVLKAREHGLSGATVLRGIVGFGAASVVHTARILRLSQDLPVVLELVDTEERIEQFIPIVDALFDEAGCGGLVTTERVHIRRYTHGDTAE